MKKKTTYDLRTERMDYIFDTHAHYDDEAFDADREEVLTGLKEQGIGCGGGRTSERDGGAYGCGYEMAGISGRKPEGCGDR